MDELQAFYDAAFPRLPDALGYLDCARLDDLPEDATHLLWLCYSLVNVSFPVEVWRQARVPDSGAATHGRRWSNPRSDRTLGRSPLSFAGESLPTS